MLALGLMGAGACSGDTAKQTERPPEKVIPMTLLAGSAGGPGTLDGNGTRARFDFPTGIVRDASGNLYITDQTAGTLRKVTPEYDVSLYAGAPNEFDHKNGTRAEARFNSPSALAMDATGNIFVTDENNHVIRKITPDGVVSTFAGKARESGDTDGVGEAARFRLPEAITIDGAGNLYVADVEASVIRRITPAGEVSTYAGAPLEGGTDDGDRTVARFFSPKGILADHDGNLWVADTGNNTIRTITKNGTVSTLAGNSLLSGLDDGEGTLATFNGPHGISLDAAGNLYVADALNNAIRKVTPTGKVTTVAGNTFGGSTDGPLSQALFGIPEAVLAVDTSAGIDLYVCDSANATIRRISLSSGQVVTLAGSAPEYGTTDGKGSDARFYMVAGMTTDATGNLIVADNANHTLRKIAPDGAVTTWIGKGGEEGFDEGQGTAARLSQPVDLVKDKSGNFFVTAAGSSRIHKITPAGDVTVYAGVTQRGGGGWVDGPRAEAMFDAPQGIAIDSQENLYVADPRNQLIRRISKDGIVSTIAGSYQAPGFRDGIGENARFFTPYDVEVDAQDNLYVSDSQNHAIRKLTKVGEEWQVTTIAGGPLTLEETPSIPGFRDGKGGEARFSHPLGLLADKEGNLLVADMGNSLVRKVAPDGTVTTLIGTPGRSGVSFDSKPATIFEPFGLAWVGDKKLAISFASGVITATLP